MLPAAADQMGRLGAINNPVLDAEDPHVSFSLPSAPEECLRYGTPS